MTVPAAPMTPPVPPASPAPGLRRAPVVALVVVVVVLAAVAVGAWLAFGRGGSSSGASGRFAQALDYAPADSTDVSYTDWAALGHPQIQATTPGYFAGSWVVYDRVLPDQIGVTSTAADWEIDAFPPAGGLQTIMKFPKAAQLTSVSKGLAQLGWKGDRSGARFVLTAPAFDLLPPDGSAGWAQTHDFVFDTKNRIMVAYPRGTKTPSVGHTGFASSKALGGVLHGAGAPVSALIRTGRSACGTAPLTQRQTPASLDQLKSAVAGLSTVKATYLGLTTKDARQARAAVALASAGAAGKESSLRAQAGSKLARLVGSDSGVTVTADGTSGAVARFKLTTDNSARISQALRRGALGIDACPIS